MSVYLIVRDPIKLTDQCIIHFSKKSLLLCFVLFVTASAFFLTCRVAQSIELLILGRILAGLASGLTTTIVPMYLIELAPLSLSGTMGVLCSMGVTGGVVVGQVFSLNEVFGNEDQWHLALGFYVVLVIGAFLTYFWWPESPKYLYVIAGEKERAKLGNSMQFSHNYAFHARSSCSLRVSLSTLFGISLHHAPHSRTAS